MTIENIFQSMSYSKIILIVIIAELEPCDASP